MPPFGRAARPFAAVVARGKHALTEGGQDARGKPRHRLVGRRDPSPPLAPVDGVPPFGRATRPFAAVMPVGRRAGLAGLEILERLAGLEGLNTRWARRAREARGETPGRARLRPRRHARGKVCHRLVGRRDPSPPSLPVGKHARAEGGPSVCSAKVPVGRHTIDGRAARPFAAVSARRWYATVW